ncbi:MAG TPA: type II toxin-antitoxin system PemK/MazF family toxin [Clostridiales bacterium]|nr:type II toxin-antitoxin system PemK/MazF family toxin [Clostridiales bacterium]
MKSPPSPQDVNHSFDEAASTLRKHFTSIRLTDPDGFKLANEYYKWTTLKTKLVMGEKCFQIPSSALPNIIKQSSYQWLTPQKQFIIDKHYRFESTPPHYVISVKKSTIPYQDVEVITRSLVLIRKSVVWVEFGFNVGTEFGGSHPAIILKNLKDSLIVIPLSSKQPKNTEYNVYVDKVYGFPPMPRWANITRIAQVSLSRVYFEKIGDVKPTILNDITSKLSDTGII